VRPAVSEEICSVVDGENLREFVEVPVVGGRRHEQTPRVATRAAAE
jgi:hypothetical protein